MGPDGSPHSLQVDDGRGWFMLNSLAARTVRTYRLRPRSAHHGPGADSPPAEGIVPVATDRRAGTVSASVDGEPVWQYWARPRPLPDLTLDPVYRRGGYLHPVRTPSGRIVTGDYPAGHLHHHGLWAAWTNTAFRGRTPDFWNMGQGTGAVEPIALDTTWAGPVHGGLIARHRYVDYSGREPVTALYEQSTVRAYALPPQSGEKDGPARYHRFDLELTQTTASASPLRLPTYHYGGVALPGPEAWYGADRAHFVTSAGHDRANGNATRARWVYMGGFVNGALAGGALLSHPDNARAPQPVRIHPEMPYFCFAPPQRGPLRIRPGAPYTARYRVAPLDGPPDAALLDRLWADYSTGRVREGYKTPGFIREIHGPYRLALRAGHVAPITKGDPH